MESWARREFAKAFGLSGPDRKIPPPLVEHGNKGAAAAAAAAAAPGEKKLACQGCASQSLSLSSPDPAFKSIARFPNFSILLEPPSISLLPIAISFLLSRTARHANACPTRIRFIVKVCFPLASPG
jgi:hypothetical protein